jgi:predicted permease
MLALIATVTLLLLLAMVNVTNLLLVRAEARQREIGVRIALGASGARLVRQLLAESLILSLAGAAVGIPLAAVAFRSLLAINPGVVPPAASISLDGAALAAVVAIVGLAALVSGILPALRARKSDVRTAIAYGKAQGGVAGRRLRSALVVVEVALAAAMLVGAGLVGRSFQQLLSVDPGFDARGVLATTIVLPRGTYAQPQKVMAFYAAALERFRAIPGVSAAAVTTSLPLAGTNVRWAVEVEGRPNAMAELTSPYFVTVAGDVFRALGIRLIRGRAFGPGDTEGSTPVVVVSEAMAREYWPGQDPLGKRIHLSGPNPWLTVVGVVRDVRPDSLSALPHPTYYVPAPQFVRTMGFVSQSMTFVLRTTGPPAALAQPVRAAIRDLDPSLAPTAVRPMQRVVLHSLARPRFAASVLGAFGLSALVLAIVGVYGVLSYAMTQRRRELAVRMALGAPANQVRRVVLMSGLRLAATGTATGLMAAVMGRRVVSSLLYQVSPTDAVTLASAAATLVLAAAAASWIPARNATAIGPAEVLRGD